MNGNWILKFCLRNVKMNCIPLIPNDFLNKIWMIIFEFLQFGRECWSFCSILTLILSLRRSMFCGVRLVFLLLLRANSWKSVTLTENVRSSYDLCFQIMIFKYHIFDSIYWFYIFVCFFSDSTFLKPFFSHLKRGFESYRYTYIFLYSICTRSRTTLHI